MEESDGTFRVRRKLRTSRAALPFLTSPSLVFVARLFRCRSAYWYAIVAPPENTRCAWKRVKRSSPLNGEQKKFPFSFPRCKPVHSCILFECFESILEEGEIRREIRMFGRRRSAHVGSIEIFQESASFHFILLRKIQISEILLFFFVFGSIATIHASNKIREKKISAKKINIINEQTGWDSFFDKRIHYAFSSYDFSV